MMFAKPFKILILPLLVLLAQDAFARECSNLFEVQREEPIISRIQDVKWLQKKLFSEGELEKIRTSEYDTKHVELYSEMLYESTKILLADFHGKDSILAKTPNAGAYLRVIISNIKSHRENKTVTRDYFLKINWTIAMFITLKNEYDPIGQRFSQRLTKAKTTKDLEKLINDDFELYNAFIPQYLKGDVVLIPTFTKLTIEDMIELGIITAKFLPIGMSTLKHPDYDGVKEASAREFNFHDFAHARDIIQARLRDGNVREVAELTANLEKLEKFYLAHRNTLTTENKFFKDRIMFSLTHEVDLNVIFQLLRHPNKFDQIWNSLDQVHNNVTNSTTKQVILNFMRRETGFEGTDAQLDAKTKASLKNLLKTFEANRNL